MYSMLELDLLFKRIVTGKAKFHWILIRCSKTPPVTLSPLVASHGRMLESSPPDTPASLRNAAVYTPFEFSPGGGEKVTLLAI